MEKGNIHLAKNKTVGIIIILMLAVFVGFGQKVERFECLDTQNGLSQNNVQSILCDSYGYLWIGTMNGLNRYDGYNFRHIKSDPTKANTLTQNRVVALFEDSLGFLWVKTNDRYYHYMIRESEEFIPFPYYSQSKLESSSFITTFFQYDSRQIMLGATKTGVYHLVYSPEQKRYTPTQYVSPDSTGRQFGRIQFFVKTESKNVYMGTASGLFYLDADDINGGNVSFKQITEGYCINGIVVNGKFWMTTNDGLLCFDASNSQKLALPKKLRNVADITFLEKSNNERNIIIGTQSEGLYVYKTDTDELFSVPTDNNACQYMYEDRSGEIWLKTKRLGIERVSSNYLSIKHFDLRRKYTPSITNDEQIFFFEDSDDDLWILTQGCGLNLYIRHNDVIYPYSYSEYGLKTLRSDNALAMCEDKSGTLWVGTSQPNGGLNRAVKRNIAFKHFMPNKNSKNNNDNYVRCLFTDSNLNIWTCSRSGVIKVYDQNMSVIAEIKDYDINGNAQSKYAVYSMEQDSDGRIWLGMKGSGVSVSDQPLGSGNDAYLKLKFHNYRNDADDPESLSGDRVYALAKDKQGQMWIGTFGSGMDRVLSRTETKLKCQRYDSENNELSSMHIRHIMFDKDNRMWIASNFGLNVAQINGNGEISMLKSFVYDPNNKKDISYNDIVHVFQDSRGWIWCSTLGGGVNLLKSFSFNTSPDFIQIHSTNGLIDDAVYAILEDDNGRMWFSTENGLSRLDVETMKIESFGENIGVSYSCFNENTCVKTASGLMLFGNINGIVQVNPNLINSNKYAPDITLVSIVVNNQNIRLDLQTKPMQTTLSDDNTVNLDHRQKNISIEFAALDFKSPEAILYQHKLEPFDKEWSIQSNDRVATYTNLNPGKYVFKVRSSNSEGVWSDKEFLLPIVIATPLWKTFGFKFSLLIVMVVLFFFALHQRTVYFNRKRETLELKVKERTEKIMIQKEQIEEQNVKLDEANKLKTRFFEIIAHDMRNPVTAFNQLLSHLVEGYGSMNNDERLKYLSYSYKSAKGTLDLLDDLLVWSRAQSNKIDYKFDCNDLSDIVKTVISSTETVAKNKSIIFKNNFVEHLYVYCDRSTVETVLRNLMTNAVKFSFPQSYIELKYEVQADKVKILVRDFGVGINDSIRNKIFSIGEKVTNKGTSGEQGTGLGLFICHEFVKGNGGTIGFESENGKGSVFWFTLPKFKADDDEKPTSDKV